jgi:hypothetical protein
VMRPKCDPRRKASTVVGATTRQNSKDDYCLTLLIEAKANAPVANAKAPLNRVELPNVATAWCSSETVKGIQNPTLDGWVESP